MPNAPKNQIATAHGRVPTKHWVKCFRVGTGVKCYRLLLNLPLTVLCQQYGGCSNIIRFKVYGLRYTLVPDYETNSNSRSV